MRSLLRIVGVAVLATAAGCASRGPLQLHVVGVTSRVVSADLESVDLAFDVEVRNDSPEPVNTPTFRYRLLVRGAQVASGDGVPGLDIPGSGPGTVTLPVRIDLRGLREAVKDIGEAREAEYDLTATFVVPFLGMTLEFPIALKGSLPLLRAPRLEVVGLETSEVSLEGVLVTVKSDLTNPNAFPVSVDDLGYELLLGETHAGDLKLATAGTVGPGETRRVDLRCRVSGMDIIRKILGGVRKEDARIVTTGAFSTPYGTARLPK